MRDRPRVVVEAVYAGREFRRVATRDERKVLNFFAMLCLAAFSANVDVHAL